MPYQVVVTGANGLVGLEVLKKIRTDYPSLHCKAFVRSDPTEVLPGVEYIKGSLPLDIPPHLFEGDKVILVHCASLLKAKTLEEFRKVNVAGTKNLLELGGRQIHKVIYASSMSVYGQGPFWEVDEKAIPAPETDLAKSRYESEEVIRSFTKKNQTSSYLLRPRFLFSDRDRETLPALLKLHEKGQMIGNGDQRFSFIGVEDYATIIACLIKRDSEPGTESLNIAYQERLSLKDMYEVFGSSNKKILRIPAAFIISLGTLLPPLRKLRTKLQLIGQNQVLDVKKLHSYFHDLDKLNGKKRFHEIVKQYKEKV